MRSPTWSSEGSWKTDCNVVVVFFFEVAFSFTTHQSFYNHDEIKNEVFFFNLKIEIKSKWVRDSIMALGMSLGKRFRVNDEVYLL